MHKKNGFVLGWVVFIIPHIVLYFLVDYLGALNAASIGAILKSPLTYFFVLLLQALFLLLWKSNSDGIKKWRNRDHQDQELDRWVTRKVVMFPKLLLYIGVLQSVLFPQLVTLFVKSIPFNTRLDISSLGFACTMFVGLPFYILFLQTFEASSQDTPFNKSIMSMKLTLRTNLVVFMLMISILIILSQGIKYSLLSSTVLEDIQTTMSRKLLPLELLGVVMSVINIYLLMRGINKRISSCESFAEVLAEGDF